MFDRFDRRQIVKLTFLWIAAMCVAALLIPLYALLQRPILALLVSVAGLVVVWRSLKLLKTEATSQHSTFVRNCRIRFMKINTFALLVSVLLVTDALM